MKKFSQINEEKVELQKGTINFIDTSDLKKYLEKTSGFLSKEGKEVVNWLIAHPNYVNELGGNGNVLANFVDRNSPNNDSEKKLIENVKEVVKNGRTLEIPTFLTETQFKHICSGTDTIENVITTYLISKYSDLIYKMRQQYYNVLSDDQLDSAIRLGILNALKNFGKETSKTKDAEKLKSYTFNQYVAQRIRFQIIEDVREFGETVRHPVSQQNKEAKQKGYITKNHAISGDKVVGSGEEGNKTVFDFINDFADDIDAHMDAEDLKSLWKTVYDEIDKHFKGDKEKSREIFYSYYGINGHEKMKNKELAEKYGIATGAISYHLKNVNNFIRTDKKVLEKLRALYSFYKECLHDADEREPHDPYIDTTSYITLEDFEYMNDLYNMQYKINSWFKKNLNSCVGDILLKSVLEMDETACRQSINNIMLDQSNPLNKKYTESIKKFVNFMYDIIDENEENISYADRIVKISKVLGKDNIMRATHMNESNTDVQDKLQRILNSDDKSNESFKILLQYYVNHQDQLKGDKEDLITNKELSDAIKQNYHGIYDEESDDAYKSLEKMVRDAAQIQD